MRLPYILGLSSNTWAQEPQDRLGTLQELENYIATQEGRQPCKVDIQNLDPSTNGQYYIKNGIEHIDLNSNRVNESEPYQSVETLFHESRHAYQNHIVQNPDLAEDQAQVQDWQMSANGGYVSYPEDTMKFSDYRFQPTEVDARETARMRTNELYQDVFQDTEHYAVFQAKKEQEILDSIEYAKEEYQLDENLSENEISDAILAEARQSMVTKYEALRAVELYVDKAQSVPSDTLSNSVHEVSNEEIVKSAGEIGGELAGGPAGAEVGKVAGEAASKTQSAMAESAGQSTEAPINAVEDTAKESPALDVSEADEQQYYGYGH